MRSVCDHGRRLTPWTGSIRCWSRQPTTPAGTAPIVGWQANATFTEDTILLDPGDSLLLFTDGLLDALIGPGETDDAAIQQILHTLIDCSANEMADALDNALDTPTTRDDTAFLVVRTT